MAQMKLGAVEARFADLIWKGEPLSSGELAAQAARELAWKKSTTYTVLRRLCDRGIFQNREGIVTALISREEFYALQSEQYVNETFEGSLPAFVAAFTRRNALSAEDAQKLLELIAQAKEG